MVLQLEKAGLTFTGKDESGQRMQVGIWFSHKKRFSVQDFCNGVSSIFGF